MIDRHDRECELKAKRKEVVNKLLLGGEAMTSAEENKLISELKTLKAELDVIVKQNELTPEFKTVSVSGQTEVYCGDNCDTLTIDGSTGIVITTNQEYYTKIAKDKGIDVKVQEDGNLSKSVEFSISKAKSKERSAEAYAPTDEELDKINALALTTQTKDSVRVFTFQAADDQLDRAYEHFSKKALQGMADLAVKNSIPMLMDHDWKMSNVNGRVFDASVKQGKLLYKTYIPVIEKTSATLEAIYSGIYSKLSVGFSIDLNDYTCDSCNKSMFLADCPHLPGSMDEKGATVTATIKNVKDNHEISLVTVPCQPEAHIRRSLGSNTEDFEVTNIGKSSNTLITVDEFREKVLGWEPIGAFIGDKNLSQDTIESDINKDIGMTDLTNETPAEVTSEATVESTEVLETKATPEAEAQASAEAKEVVVKVEVDAALQETLNSLIAKVDEISKKLEEASAKLDVAMSASTDSLTKKLEELKAEQAPAGPAPRSKHYVLDRFTLDLGGRKE